MVSGIRMCTCQETHQRVGHGFVRPGKEIFLCLRQSQEPELRGCARFESGPVSKRCSLLQKVPLRLKSKYMLEILGEQRKPGARVLL